MYHCFILTQWLQTNSVHKQAFVDLCVSSLISQSSHYSYLLNSPHSHSFQWATVVRESTIGTQMKFFTSFSCFFRSQTNLTFFSNEKSIWEASCETRTAAPISSSPTISPAPSINSTVQLSIEGINGTKTPYINVSTTPTITPAPDPLKTTVSPSYIGTSLSTTYSPTDSPTEPFDLDKEW
jgi:hypothetical protein